MKDTVSVNWLVFIIGTIIGALITQLINIFFSPLKKWFYDTRKEQCAYEKFDTGSPGLKEIVVTTKFGKTSHINCYWFNKRKSATIDGVSYKHCIYGEKFLTPNGKGAAQCPYDKQYVQT